MRRKEEAKIAVVSGWRDERPNLTSDEHDMLVAMVEQAWHDVQIDPDDGATVPASRREEASAIKVSAWEWLTKLPEEYLEEGENPPRIGFRAVCLHLDLHEESVRWACLHRNCKPPHEILAKPVANPTCPMPDIWRQQFIGPDDPEHNREDPVYVHSETFQIKKAAKQVIKHVNTIREHIDVDATEWMDRNIQKIRSLLVDDRTDTDAIQLATGQLMAVAAAYAQKRKLSCVRIWEEQTYSKALDVQIRHGTLADLKIRLGTPAPNAWDRWNGTYRGDE